MHIRSPNLFKKESHPGLLGLLTMFSLKGSIREGYHGEGHKKLVNIDNKEKKGMGDQYNWSKKNGEDEKS